MVQQLNVSNIAVALQSNAPKLVVTHKNCMDGCTCKALWRSALVGKSAQFVELDYAQISLDTDRSGAARRMQEFFMHIKDHDVMISDFSLPLEWMQALVKNNRSFSWMDHHESAKHQLGYFVQNSSSRAHAHVSVLFDESNGLSGAALTQMGIAPGAPLSEFVALISDGDVWRFEHEQRTRHLYHGFFERYGDPKDVPMDLLQQALIDPSVIERMCAIGAPAYERYERQVALYAQDAKPIRLKGIDGWMLCVPKAFISDVGAYVAQHKGGFALLYSVDKQTGALKCSLRSASDTLVSSDGTSYSMNTLADAFAGGGHKRAAAFLCQSLEHLMQLNELSTKA